MFKIIATIAALSAVPVSAQTATETCANFGNAGMLIMTARQGGTSISKVMEVMDNDLFRRLVMEAYGEPRYSSQENKERSIEDFRNKVEIACFKEFL